MIDGSRELGNGKGKARANAMATAKHAPAKMRGKIMEVKEVGMSQMVSEDVRGQD